MKHSYIKQKQLYTLLKQSGLHEQRHMLVSSFSDGRTENSAELSTPEIEKLIEHLQNSSTGNIETVMKGFMRGDKMRKRILSLAHQYGWTNYDAVKRSNVIDFAKLNSWMKKYSYMHKTMNAYAYNELPKLVEQFERVVVSYLETI